MKHDESNFKSKLVEISRIEGSARKKKSAVTRRRLRATAKRSKALSQMIVRFFYFDSLKSTKILKSKGFSRRCNCCLFFLPLSANAIFKEQRLFSDLL